MKHILFLEPTSLITEEWAFLFKNIFKKYQHSGFFKKIDNLYKNKTVYPERNKLFNAFNAIKSPLDVKIVILGQDPYHTENVADGLAFSSGLKGYIPPSLRNIYKEFEYCSKLDYDYFKNKYKFNIAINKEYVNCYTSNKEVEYDLYYLANQGVLLLNTSLMVLKNEPASLTDIGWDKFLLNCLYNLLNVNKNIIFILLGAKAKKFIDIFESKTKIKTIKLETTHPSPFSANRGFIKSGIFHKANVKLIELNNKPIDWLKPIKINENYED